MKKKSKFKISTSQFILLGFMAVILLGSLMLSLPVSSATGESVPYIDALFTATTSTCVTGLVTVPTATTWSLFGQIVILILIQIGGLGVVTVISGIMIMVHKKIGIGDRLLIQDAFNLNTLNGLVSFVKKVLAGTLIVEAVGALFYMIVFVPDFGARGIWISIFNSVSAFCNAGMDIFATDSLCSYATNPIINIVTCLLIILGGLGYIVWWDIIRISGYRKTGIKSRVSRLTLSSKIAIIATLVFLVAGALLIFICEYNNPETIGSFSLFDKIQASFFQSVTCRTAGFMTIPQENFTNSSVVVSVFLMLVGGSPVGTAGGIKTVTVVVLFLTAFSVIKGDSHVSVLGRRISEQTIRKSVAVTAVAIIVLITSTVLLSLVTPDASLTDIVYETASATATVGLSRNLTSFLNVYGKIIIIFTMYFGRIGPISLAFALKLKKENKKIVKDPVEEISVG